MGVLSGLFHKQPEAPAEERAYPPGWMIPLLEGGKSTTGISVTVESAMKWTVFYAAVDLISRGVAQLPLHLYRRKENDGRERATGHPLYKLLHDRPNKEQTAFCFWEVMQGWELTWGNAYAEIERNRMGRPVALWPLPPNKMEVQRDDAGELLYVQKGDGGQIVAQLPAINVLHCHALGDGLVGWSPVRQFREAIGLGLGAEQYSAAFFGNDASPGGILEHPGKISPEAIERLRKSWAEKHAGSSNARKPAILEQGLTWKQVGIAPEDSQLIESRQFQVVDICRVFHIPPHKLQDLLRATFSNIEHQAIEYVQDCLGPWLASWEQEVNYKLLMPSEQGKMYAEFLTEGMLRGDIKTRSLHYRQMWGIGAMTQNEIRQKENMAPIEGGDEPWVPMNMVAISKHPMLNPPEPAPAPSISALEEANRVHTQLVLAIKADIRMDIEAGLAKRRERDAEFVQARNLAWNQIQSRIQGMVDAVAKQGVAITEAICTERQALASQLAEAKVERDAAAQAASDDRAQCHAYHAALQAGFDSFAKRADQIERMLRAAMTDKARVAVAHRTLLLELCERIVRRETGAMRKAAKRFAIFRETANEFYNTHGEVIEKVLGAAIAAYAAAMGDGDRAEAYTADLARQWTEQARAQVHDIAERRLPALMDEWEAKRPTEMTEKILGDFNHAKS